MHSLRHTGMSLDSQEPQSRWRFQLLPRPDAEATNDWSKITVPGSWTMQGFDDLPHYTNVQMPFVALPPDVPEANPTGLYERVFDWSPDDADHRVVLHLGAAESVALVSLNGEDVGSPRTPTSPPSSTSPASSMPGRTA